MDRPRPTQPGIYDTDPEDPAQQLIPDDGSGDADDGDSDEADPAAAGEERVKDTGELYGVRTPHAADRDLSAPEDRDAFKGADRGENWTEALAEHATEGGPSPEEEVVIVDDSDPERGHSPSESGDRPVADKGSGGPGGM
jgi:hypothetical protein